MAYEKQCGSCYEFKDKDNTDKPFDIYYANKEKGYCDYYHTFYWAEDGDDCYHYKNKDTHVPGTCYITTIICDKLGYSDDCGVLNTLRSFRDNVMQKNCKYCGILFEYDVIGPKISEMIRNDKDSNPELWAQFYNFYLSATANFVHEEKYDEAISRYTEMISALKDYYGIQQDIVEIVKDYDMSQGGHGKVKILERKEEFDI